MIYPSENLTKRYYFVENNVIYKISSSNDEDGCGELPGYEDGKLQTEEVEKRFGTDGHTENDSNGNIIKETVVKNSVYASIYPNICIKYKRCSKANDGSRIVGTYEFTKYLWLDNLISIGDRFTSNKFDVGAKHGKDGDTDFNKRYARLVKEFIISKAVSNSTVDPTVLRSGYPYYVRDTDDANDAKYTVIDGWDVEIQSVIGSSNLFDEGEIMTAVENHFKQNALDTINKAMKPFNKQYTTISLS